MFLRPDHTSNTARHCESALYLRPVLHSVFATHGFVSFVNIVFSLLMAINFYTCFSGANGAGGSTFPGASFVS
jgi:hypothetical protein